MNNSLLPGEEEEKKKVPQGIEPNRLFSLHQEKKTSTKSYQHSAFSTIGAQIIDYAQEVHYWIWCALVVERDIAVN